MLGFILADLRRSWPGALAVCLIVAFATALGVAVTLQERALRLGSARAANAFDLVVGAPGSETQLVLSGVFLQPAPLPLMPGSVMAGLSTDPRVQWAAPVGFGDAYQGWPVVGTSQALVDGLGGIAAGATFHLLGDAVVGADVPLKPGDSFHPVHAELAETGEVHQGATYTVRGRLAPTGSPWDRAILVPIEAVWQVHGSGEDHDDHDADAEAVGGPSITTTTMPPPTPTGRVARSITITAISTPTRRSGRSCSPTRLRPAFRRWWCGRRRFPTPTTCASNTGRAAPSPCSRPRC